MKRGFTSIMSAQFASSLADNALFVVAVGLLQHQGAADWQSAALVPVFAFFYVVLAPVAGPFADAMPKRRVMAISNAIKAGGCLMMCLGVHPLLAYSVVGLGAAIYSPAKYGILTELLPSSQLVKANGWIEGLTIASIVLGVVLGGLMVSETSQQLIFSLVHTRFAIPGDPVLLLPVAVMLVYVLAAIINTRIPDTGAVLHRIPENLPALLSSFGECNRLLWHDRLGQIALATTTLFWGVSGNLRYIVLAWAAVALGYSTTQASTLVGVVAIGTAAGAILASFRVRLGDAPRVIPLGAALGVLLMLLVPITSASWAAALLLVAGATGGYMLVPMNALLQHRGHDLMGAGRSIAVQNFNEQACILLIGLLYSVSAGGHPGVYFALIALGAMVVVLMILIGVKYRNNISRHPREVARLLKMARLNEDL